jgi:3-methylcrotonyl-CoA carboxylase beta subunit
MSGRAFDSRFLFSWPHSQIAVMGAEQAANTLADIKIRQLAKHGQDASIEQIESIREPVLAEFERKQSAYWSTSEIWDDGILDPVDTRNALGIALSASLHAPFGDPRYGVFRM